MIFFSIPVELGNNSKLSLFGSYKKLLFACTVVYRCNRCWIEVGNYCREGRQDRIRTRLQIIKRSRQSAGPLHLLLHTRRPVCNFADRPTGVCVCTTCACVPKVKPGRFKKTFPKPSPRGILDITRRAPTLRSNVTL